MNAKQTNTTKSFNLIGMKIVGQHGRDVGRITEVFVNLDTLNVDQIEVKLDRETLDDLKLKLPLIGTQTVRIPSAEISGISDVLVLKSQLEDIEFLGGKAAETAKT